MGAIFIQTITINEISDDFLIHMEMWQTYSAYFHKMDFKASIVFMSKIFKIETE